MPLIDGAADDTGVAGGLAAGPGGRLGGPDDETAQWLSALGGTGTTREQALARLHGLLLRVARAELGRRAGRHPITGPELDDLAHQSADDALFAITTKLAQFRGDSRFTTWACRFVVLEVSSKLGRHFWQHPSAALGAADWDQLPDRFGTSPADHAERHDLVTAVRRAVEEELTERQRRGSSPSRSTASRSTRWWCSWVRAATRSTRRCSTRGVSCGPRWLLTGI